MEENIKEVLYYKWCGKCVHEKKAENEDPCWDCLDQGWNYDSTKPINFKPKEE